MAWKFEPERNRSLIVCDINWTEYRTTLQHVQAKTTRYITTSNEMQTEDIQLCRSWSMLMHALIVIMNILNVA